jgi:hypothetical protein
MVVIVLGITIIYITWFYHPNKLFDSDKIETVKIDTSKGNGEVKIEIKYKEIKE